MTLPKISPIIIIGGGFSGMSVAINLIRKAKQPMHLLLVEKTGKMAKGVAYSTPEPYHLLNVPGHNMGAFASNPNHFLEWLTANELLWRTYDTAFNTLPIEPGRYYPRKLYGLYLESIFQDVLKEAAQKSITLEIIVDEAVDVEITEHRTAIIKLKKRMLPESRHIVIATGNMPVKAFTYAQSILSRDKYIENMWSENGINVLNNSDISSLPKATNIAIIGTGLTMVDAFLSLRRKGYKGKITAVSRHGKLPHPHQSVTAYPPFLDAGNYPRTAYALLRTVRNEIKKAKAAGYDWRSVLQELRPHTNAIWSQLPVRERRYIARRLMSYWNIHRHRIPPEILALLEHDIQSGTLTIIPGTIYYIGEKNNGPLMLSYRKHGEDFIQYTAADYVINCSGPETDLAKSNNPFLQKLADKGIIHVGTLRMGLELTPGGRVKGKAPDIFHAVGALIVGEQLESTAVPDIRVQTETIAENIILGTNEDYSSYYQYFI